MRIAFLIESLGAGGAERQMVNLATGLFERGHDIAVAYYDDRQFFRPMLEEAGIEPVFLNELRTFSRVRKVAGWLKSYKPDLVQSYLRGSNLTAEWASVFGKRYKLVVSERSMYGWYPYQISKYGFAHQNVMNHVADWMVLNSHHSMENLKKYAPLMVQKASVIWNIADLETFRPLPGKKDRGKPFRFVAVSSYHRCKNAPRVAGAVRRLVEDGYTEFKVTWLGRIPEKPEPEDEYRKVDTYLKRHDLSRYFETPGRQSNVHEYLQKADALLHVTKFEGLPNAVVEGMASGLPIVASRVSDVPRMVTNGENGFLCDAYDVDSIVAVMKSCMDSEQEDLVRMGRVSRQRAERMFNKEHFLDNYENLYARLLAFR